MYRLTRAYRGIIIDAGHGGNDPGASGNGIIEKELTLEIANYIHNRLDELGIRNTMVRTTDETVEPTERVNRVLDPYGSGSDVIVVSNHINAGGADNWHCKGIYFSIFLFIHNTIKPVNKFLAFVKVK